MRGLSYNSSADVDEQVLPGPVQELDHNVLIALFVHPQCGLDLKAGKYLDYISRKSGEVSVLEPESAALLRCRQLAAAYADLIEE